MGYKIERFDGEVDPDLVCSICNGVMTDPMQTPCDHTFCRDCITKVVAEKSSCPIDKTAVKTSDLEPAPRLVRRMIGRLNIACDNNSNGCQEKVNLESLSRHLLRCEFGPDKKVGCANGCGAVVARRDMKTHSCIQELKAQIQKEVRDLRSSLAAAAEKEKGQERLDRQMQDMSNDISGLIVELRNTTKKEISGMKAAFEQTMEKERQNTKKLEDRILKLSSDLTHLRQETRSALEKETMGLKSDLEKQLDEDRLHVENVDKEVRNLKKSMADDKDDTERLIDEVAAEAKRDLTSGLAAERAYCDEAKRSVQQLTSEVDILREDLEKQGDETQSHVEKMTGEIGDLADAQETLRKKQDDALSTVQEDLASEIRELADSSKTSIADLNGEIDRIVSDQRDSEANFATKLQDLRKEISEAQTEIRKNQVQSDDDQKAIRDEIDNLKIDQEDVNKELTETLKNVENVAKAERADLQEIFDEQLQQLKELVTENKEAADDTLADHSKQLDATRTAISNLRRDCDKKLEIVEIENEDRTDKLRSELIKMKKELEEGADLEHNYITEVDTRLDENVAILRTDLEEISLSEKTDIQLAKEDLHETIETFHQIFEKNRDREHEFAQFFTTFFAHLRQNLIEAVANVEDVSEAEDTVENEYASIGGDSEVTEGTHRSETVTLDDCAASV